MIAIKPGTVVRFTPEAKRNRVTVLAEFVSLPDNVAELAFIYGRRCTADGVIDSQAKTNCYPVRRTATIEVRGEE